MELNAAVGLGVRWAHLVSGLLVVGAFGALLLAGRSLRPTALVWERRVVRGARAALLVALATGLVVLAQQAALAEGRAGAALEVATLARFALGTQGGLVWIARHGLLMLAAAFVVLAGLPRDHADWLAARGEPALLAGAAMALLGVSGHAAAVEPGTARAVAVDALHLLAAGLWVGGLVPLAALLVAASTEIGAEARPYAVLAVRRFSRLALAAMLTLVVTGAINASTHVGSTAPLLGTLYGRLLLAKLALLVVVLGLAAANRHRLLPALGGDGATVGRPAMRRLAACVGVEAVLALLILAAVAAMGATPPALHDEPVWPLPFRLSGTALADDPGALARVLVGSQLAVLGASAALAAIALRARRASLLGGGGVLLAAGTALAVPPLAIDAYPTTYLRPAVTYHAHSIAEGRRLYAEHCVMCHGAGGIGDGPAGAGLPRPPADLTAAHTGHHTAGDLFWWITRGISRSGMPGFAERTTAEQRWDLVNFVRALGAAAEIRVLPAAVTPRTTGVVAPDFSFAVGPMPVRSLRDYRGRRAVLLVLYTLPGSRERLTSLASAYGALIALGAEVIAVPRDGGADAIRRLGDVPRVFFPVVTEGAAEIVGVYGHFAAGDHAEFLIDRQGYLRALRTGVDPRPTDAEPLLENLRTLVEEAVTLPPADVHVH